MQDHPAPTDGATLSLQHLSGLPPESIEALYALGHHLYRQARYAEAVRPFAFLITLNPCDVRFHKGLGACKQMLRRYDDALQHYAVASLLDMTDPFALLHSAECLLSLGRRGEARERLKLALGQIEAHPRHAGCGVRVLAVLDLLAAGEAMAAPSS